MDRNFINDISLKMLYYGERWDQELFSIIQSIDNLDQKDKEGRTLLIHCCTYHYPLSFKYLIQKGADVNIQDKKGFSALHVAAMKGEYHFVKTLLENGARTELEDIFGNNPLFRVKYNQIELIQLLVDRGCDIYHKNKYGKSAYDILSLHPETRNILQ